MPPQIPQEDLKGTPKHPSVLALDDDEEGPPSPPETEQEYETTLIVVDLPVPPGFGSIFSSLPNPWMLFPPPQLGHILSSHFPEGSTVTVLPPPDFPDLLPPFWADSDLDLPFPHLHPHHVHHVTTLPPTTLTSPGSLLHLSDTLGPTLTNSQETAVSTPATASTPNNSTRSPTFPSATVSPASPTELTRPPMSTTAPPTDQTPVSPPLAPTPRTEITATKGPTSTGPNNQRAKPSDH